MESWLEGFFCCRYMPRLPPVVLALVTQTEQSTQYYPSLYYLFCWSTFAVLSHKCEGNSARDSCTPYFSHGRGCLCKKRAYRMSTFCRLTAQVVTTRTTGIELIPTSEPWLMGDGIENEGCLPYWQMTNRPPRV